MPDQEHSDKGRQAGKKNPARTHHVFSTTLNKPLQDALYLAELATTLHNEWAMFVAAAKIHQAAQAGFSIVQKFVGNSVVTATCDELIVHRTILTRCRGGEANLMRRGNFPKQLFRECAVRVPCTSSPHHVTPYVVKKKKTFPLAARSCRLFDSLVLPILSYASEVWAVDEEVGKSAEQLLDNF